MTHQEQEDRGLQFIKDYAKNGTLCRMYRYRSTGSLLLEITDNGKTEEITIPGSVYKPLAQYLINQLLAE